MARPERFELPASWFVARRSIQLSYGRKGREYYHNDCRSPFPQPQVGGGTDTSRPAREINHIQEFRGLKTGSAPSVIARARICGGEGAIRPLEGLLTLTPLAGARLRPLGHLSGLALCGPSRSAGSYPPEAVQVKP